MARQITLDELRDELAVLIGDDNASDAVDVIERHLIAGDRIKQPAAALSELARQPRRFERIDPSLYKVGDNDPTPNEPPWCGARHQDPEGGAWCTWRPGHVGPHVSADDQGILAVFTEHAGWHKYAGLTADEIKAASVAETAQPDAGALRDDVNRTARQDKSTEGELAAEIRTISELLVAITERLEK